MRDNLHKDSAYQSPPWWYDVRGYFILRLAYQSTLFYILKFFNQNMGEKHLEAAVGSGSFLYLLLLYRKFKKESIPNQIEAFDYSIDMLAGAKARFKNDKNVHLIQANVEKLPYESDFFDTVNIANSIHCFANVDKSLLEINRVLKSGGTLAGNVLLYPQGSALLNYFSNRINNWGIKKGILETPYSEEDIKERIKKTGFEIVKEQRTKAMYCFIAHKR